MLKLKKVKIITDKDRHTEITRCLFTENAVAYKITGIDTGITDDEILLFVFEVGSIPCLYVLNKCEIDERTETEILIEEINENPHNRYANFSPVPETENEWLRGIVEKLIDKI